MDLKKGELGLRFSVPAEMTDIYERLRVSAPKRRSFEALHLMRLGLAFERLSHGGSLSTTASLVAPADRTGALTVAPVPATRLDTLEPPPCNEQRSFDGGFFEVR